MSDQLAKLIADTSDTLAQMEAEREEITEPLLAEVADAIIRAMRETLKAAQLKQKREFS